MRSDQNINSWLDTAVSGVRFFPDREAVREELLAHIEDKEGDLRRIFPDIPEEEARERALAGMGDPEEVRKELAKVHKPWLGRLWLASKIALGILTFWALMVAPFMNDAPWENRLVGYMPGYHKTEFGVPDHPEPAQAKQGGYTFQIINAACREGHIYDNNIRVIFRVSSLKFWERIEFEGVRNALTVIAPDGTAYPMDEPIDWEEGRRAQVDVTECRWGFFYRDFSVSLDAAYTENWSPDNRVTLDFDFELGSFTLSTGVTERVRW